MQVFYGGRITDDFDQLLMNTYADRYFNQPGLAVGYELFRDSKADFSYVVPDSTEIEVFRNAIESFPSQDSPEAFGLHTNADLTFRTLQVSQSGSHPAATSISVCLVASRATRAAIPTRLQRTALQKGRPVFLLSTYLPLNPDTHRPVVTHRCAR